MKKKSVHLPYMKCESLSVVLDASAVERTVATLNELRLMF